MTLNQVSAMKDIIFFDLDGTLINPKIRYCTIYKELCSQIGVKPLDCDAYWNLKRQKVSEDDILKKSDIKSYDIKNILKKRITMLEDMEFLQLDTLYAGVIEFLELVCQKYTLVIVTLRKNRPALEKQLKSLGIANYFDKILSASPSLNPKYLNKVKLIQDNYDNSLKGIFFGDTEVDILSAKYLNIQTVSCNFGIRDEKILFQYNPDFNINTWNSELIKKIGI